MAHSYRRLQHWNRWLSEQYLGNVLLSAEYNILSSMLAKHFGKHTLLIGVPNQAKLFGAATIPCHSLISPWEHRSSKFNSIEANLNELPIFSGSIDLVMLPHTLEFVDNPRQLLAEACRVIKPEGLIAICGFNPYSLWRIWHVLAKGEFPWSRNMIHSSKIKTWLKLVDFELEQQQYIMFRPPIQRHALYQQLSLLEKFAKKFLPFVGGVYTLIARAKVIPLTPIKLQWKQHLSGIRISPTISTHMRQE